MNLTGPQQEALARKLADSDMGENFRITLELLRECVAETIERLGADDCTSLPSDFSYEVGQMQGHVADIGRIASALLTMQVIETREIGGQPHEVH